MVEIEDIVKMSSYFSIISHTPGRLRVRVSPKIVENKGNISLKDVESLPKKISGIHEITIKKIIASVTIKYDPKVFAPRLWEDLIAKRNLDEVKEIINNLAKEVKEFDN